MDSRSCMHARVPARMYACMYMRAWHTCMQGMCASACEVHVRVNAIYAWTAPRVYPDVKARRGGRCAQHPPRP
eukprot:364242-Chlamydomonas_euryale.AAC.4